MRIKVYPKTSFFVEYFKRRGIKLVDSQPHTLHYVGDSLSELKSLLKKDKPDFLVTHSRSFLDKIKYFQAYQPLSSLDDLLRITKVITNKLILARTYYEKLGLQVEFETIPPKKKEVNFPSRGNLVSFLKTFKYKFFSFMKWS